MQELRICVSCVGCSTQSPMEALQALSCHAARAVVMGCRQQRSSSFQLELKQSGNALLVAVCQGLGSHHGFWSGTKSVVTVLLLGGSTSSWGQGEPAPGEPRNVHSSPSVLPLCFPALPSCLHGAVSLAGARSIPGPGAVPSCSVVRGVLGRRASLPSAALAQGCNFSWPRLFLISPGAFRAYRIPV